jgi:hypothetical protein
VGVLVQNWQGDRWNPEAAAFLGSMGILPDAKRSKTVLPKPYGFGYGLIFHLGALRAALHDINMATPWLKQV